VTSVRGKGCAPTMAASSGLGVNSFMKAEVLGEVFISVI
jgi:hypothetical protein